MPVTKFKEILRICENRGFFKLTPNTHEISLNSIGYLLQENLKTEWLLSNLINRDINVFLNNRPTIQESYDFVKDINQDRLPFGIAQITTTPPETGDNTEYSNEIDAYFYRKRQFKLQTFTFIAPSLSTEYFHKWQRQRRIWWRKFSASPGRYTLTDIQTSNSGEQNVEIKSSYPWGSHIMEKIDLIPNCDLFLTKEQLQAKVSRKRVQPHCIISTCYLTTMVLNTVCDAYDDPLYQGEKRPLFRFHRKLAPYKISFAISVSKSSNTDELSDLAVYLCKKLRGNNTSVLLLQNISRLSLETQWCQYDQLGIPYCIVLNDSTLRNGVAHLRSRDTTLKEQVHISDLTSYIEKLYRNY